MIIMDLKRYYDKTVLITTVKGKVFSGKVNDYFYPDDNESGLESIVIDTPDGSIIEFTEENIETITEI